MSCQASSEAKAIDRPERRPPWAISASASRSPTRRHRILLLEQQAVAGTGLGPVQLHPHVEEQVVVGRQRIETGDVQVRAGMQRPSQRVHVRASHPDPPSAPAPARRPPHRRRRGAARPPRPAPATTGGHACASWQLPVRPARRSSPGHRERVAPTAGRSPSRGPPPPARACRAGFLTACPSFSPASHTGYQSFSATPSATVGSSLPAAGGRDRSRARSPADPRRPPPRARSPCVGGGLVERSPSQPSSNAVQARANRGLSGPGPRAPRVVATVAPSPAPGP